ncbi:MAG: LysM peptidoglycan-binding domain-containing protein [Algicola sp.]|nr:LysM peptidoglycan-binding domain-containing protein [Algicola sp.]
MIDKILAGDDIDDATVQPNKLRKSKVLQSTPSPQPTPAPKQVQVEKPAQKEITKQTPLSNDKPPAPVVQDQLPEPSINSKHKLYGLALLSLVVVSGGAFFMLQNEPQTPIATNEPVKQQTPDPTATIVPVKIPEPVATPEPENFSQQFDQMTADGKVEIEEDELFFELWDDSSPEEQSQWKIAVFKEKLSFEESTDPLRMAKNEYIIKMLDEIENLEIDNAPIIVTADVDPVSPVLANTTTKPDPVASQVVDDETEEPQTPDKKPANDSVTVQVEEPLLSTDDKDDDTLASQDEVHDKEQKEEQVVVVADSEQIKPVAVVQGTEEKAEPESVQPDERETELLVVNTPVESEKTAAEDEPVKKPAKTASVEKLQLKPVVHKVVTNETLYGISKKYNVSIDSLSISNPGIKNLLIAGKRINIPGSKTYEIVEKDTLSAISKKYNVTISKLVSLNPGIDKVLRKGREIIIPGNNMLEEVQLQSVFDKLLNDKSLSFENLKAFDNQWYTTSGSVKLKIYEFEGFSELNQRLQQVYTQVKQGESDRDEKEGKLIKRVATKFNKVKLKLGK